MIITGVGGPVPRFKEWARSKGFNLEQDYPQNCHRYKDPITQVAWQAYYAAYNDYYHEEHYMHMAARIVLDENDLGDAYLKELGTAPWLGPGPRPRKFQEAWKDYQAWKETQKENE